VQRTAWHDGRLAAAANLNHMVVHAGLFGRGLVQDFAECSEPGLEFYREPRGVGEGAERQLGSRPASQRQNCDTNNGR
jgi:hypothetical protein